jgi:hypothetical protein
MDWQEITLGQLYNGFSQGLGAIASRSPVKVHLEVDTRFARALWWLLSPVLGMAWWGVQRIAGALPPASQRCLPGVKRPHWQRTATVETVLSTAWSSGQYRYSDLIETVRDQTGRGCSRRAIARFKRSQGLL